MSSLNARNYEILKHLLEQSKEHLQNVFVDRWKNEALEEWKDDTAHMEKLLDKLKKIKTGPKMKTFEKRTLMDSTSVKNWDLSLLRLVLLKLGSDTQYEKENTAVRKLKEIRNHVEHAEEAQISKTMYAQDIQLFKESLVDLGLNPKRVLEMIQQAESMRSANSADEIKRLHLLATEFVEQNKYIEAAKCLSEAISSPGLSAVDLATAYEMRADFYLNAFRGPLSDQMKLQMASLDIAKSLTYNESSYSGHAVAAQCCRRLNKLPEAIAHCHRALAISPGQVKIKSFLDSCKLLAACRNSAEPSDPASLPICLKERLDAELEPIKENLRARGEIGETTGGPGEYHLLRGIRLAYGLGVSNNDLEASIEFLKAARLRSAEGLMYVARSLLHGLGVNQDVENAVMAYQMVAKWDPNSPGHVTKRGCNIGVACSQFVLGSLYQHGVGVEMNLSAAADWYRQSMLSGIGAGAYSLGVMYYNGILVHRDDKQAEECWNQGASLCNGSSAAALVNLYLRRDPPKKAVIAAKLARKFRHPAFENMSDEMLETLLGTGDIHLSSKFDQQQDSAGPKLRQALTDATRNVAANWTLADPLHERKGHKGELTLHLVQSVWNKAEKGSQVAAEFRDTVQTMIHINYRLTDGFNELKSEEKQIELVNLFYKCVTLMHYDYAFTFLTEPAEAKLKVIIEGLLKGKLCQEAGQQDMKVRLCYVVLNLRESMSSRVDKYDLELLREGIMRYPSNVHYYIRLAGLCCIKGDYQMARRVLSNGLETFPNNSELLFISANLVVTYGSTEESIAAIQRFLSAAPCDHPNVPYMYYNVAGFHMKQLSRQRRPELVKGTIKAIEENFMKGQESEGKQLPIYLPYEASHIKSFIREFLEKNVWKESAPVSSVETGRRAGVLERKAYLRESNRHELIFQHRQLLVGHDQVITRATTEITSQLYGCISIRTLVPARLQQKMVKNESVLMAITLNEMKVKTDHIYENRVLELTVIDDVMGMGIRYLIGEDECGSATRLFLNNTSKCGETMNALGAGCKIAIANPYMWFADAHISGIRNDERSCLRFLKKLESMCTFCHDEHAKYECRKCRRPYCSRECEELDKKLLGHVLICDSGKNEGH